MTDTSSLLRQVDDAAAAGHLTAAAAAHIRVWLTNPHYAEYVAEIAQHIHSGQWKQLDDVFWTVIPFGTGGRRGMMYPIGTNAINDRTIGESAQGLADYVRQQYAGQPLSCAIAYDTRHKSRHFAQLCAEVMVAAGIRVFFLDGYRSTPELSFAVRFKQCVCGIMVTASHNPPSDNAVKAYWSHGGQLLPPHDMGVIDRVMSVGAISRTPFDAAVAAGSIVICQEEVDRAFIAAVVRQSSPGPRDLRIIYSPLHGVGTSAVCPALAAAGFADVEVFGPHAAPDPDFTNVPGRVSNPENAAVFDALVERGKQAGADLVLATDPDCDRLGAAAPLTLAPDAPWATITGNQIGALLTDHLLSQRQAAGTLTPQHYVVKTLVTSELIRRIAEHYGVETVGDLLVGFKYIGGVLEERDPAQFILGAEESYGFLVGDHARDKDGAVAAMLLAELAAAAKAQGQSLHQRLDDLFERFGCHLEDQLSLTMPGAEGMSRMQALMAGLRARPPIVLGGMEVTGVRDYLSLTCRSGDGPATALAGPRGDLLFLDLAPPGNAVAVRPSGTEPKIKFYLFAYRPPQGPGDMAATRQQLAKRLARLRTHLEHLPDIVT